MLKAMLINPTKVKDIQALEQFACCDCEYEQLLLTEY